MTSQTIGEGVFQANAGKSRQALESGHLLSALYESIDRLDFFAHHRAMDAPTNPRYAEAYVSILRVRLADVAAAITALSGALPFDGGSKRIPIQPPKVRQPTLRSMDSSLWRA